MGLSFIEVRTLPTQAELIAEKALQSASSAHRRIDKLEEDVKDTKAIAMAVARMDEKLDNTTNDVVEVKENIKEVSQKLDSVADVPKKRYERFIDAGIGAVSTGLIAAILALILK